MASEIGQGRFFDVGEVHAYKRSVCKFYCAISAMLCLFYDGLEAPAGAPLIA